MDLRSHSQRHRCKVKDAPIFLVGNFRDGDLLAVSGYHSHIVHLAAAGRIKRSTVEHDGMAAIAGKRFDHASVEVVEKRIVVIKAISHWEKSALSLQLFSY